LCFSLRLNLPPHSNPAAFARRRRQMLPVPIRDPGRSGKCIRYISDSKHKYTRARQPANESGLVPRMPPKRHERKITLPDLHLCAKVLSRRGAELGAARATTSRTIACPTPSLLGSRHPKQPRRRCNARAGIDHRRGRSSGSRPR